VHDPELHLFFDLGETLVDLRGLVPAMAQELRTAFPNRRFRPEAVATEWVKRTAQGTVQAQGPKFRPGFDLTCEALQAALDSAGVRIDWGQAAALVDKAWGTYLDRPKLYDDVGPPLFQALRSMARTLGVVTDSDNRMVRPLFRRLGLSDVFDVIIVSESVRAYKPEPRIYRAALDAVHAKPEASLFVSDSTIDLQGASRVGMGTIWIRRRPTSDSPAPPGARILNDLRKLPAVLRAIN
jgi:2-haloacid dehalogenase